MTSNAVDKGRPASVIDSDWHWWLRLSSRTFGWITVLVLLTHVGQIIQSVILHRATDFAIAGDQSRLFAWAGAYAFSKVVLFVHQYYLSIFDYNTRTRLAWSLRERLLFRWLREGSGHAHSGKLQELFTSDVVTVIDGKAAQYSFAGNLIGAVISYGYLLHLNVSAGVAAVITGICGAVVSIIFTSSLQKAHVRAREAALAAGQEITDIVNNALLIKAYNATQPAVDVCAHACNARCEAEIFQSRLQAIVSFLKWLCFDSGQLFVYIVLGLQVIHGNATPGVIVAYLQVLSMANSYPQRMMTEWQTWQNGAASTKLITEMVRGDVSQDILRVKEEQRWEYDGAKPYVVCKDLSVVYPGTKSGIDGVSLEVKAGDVVHIFGANGSGKSTLVNAIAGLLGAARGYVVVNGVYVQPSTARIVRDQISWASEDGMLFRGTVEENLKLGRPSATPEEVRAACRLTGLDQVVEDLPNGLATVVGEEGGNLSGGQRQLVSLTRAVLRDGSIVILDDAFSAIDATRRRLLYESLPRWLTGKVGLIASSNPEDSRLANRKVTLVGGRVVAEERRREGEVSTDA